MLGAVARAALFVALFLLLWSAAVVLLAPVAIWLGAPPIAMQGGTMLLAALAAGWTLLVLADNGLPDALGFHLDRSAIAESAVGFAIGGAMLAVAVAALWAVGGLDYVARPGGAPTEIGRAWLHGLLVLALPAFAEEALFRGYPFQVLVRGVGAVAATLAVSALFALVHAQNPAAERFGLLNIFLAGVLLSIAFLRTGSLWFASTLHLAWNWAMASVADLPVSGLSYLDTPGYEPVLAGPRWLTGGAFGPEGGAVGTLGFGAGLVAVWWCTREPRPGSALVLAGHAGRGKAEEQA
ncbi:MAG: lysostaphin resistance A-like protein [Longimicrobiales bacterium]